MPRRYSGFTSTSNRASTTSKSPTRPPSSLMRCANGLHRTRRHGTIARLVGSGNARIEQAAHDHWRRVHAPLFHDELGVRALARSRRAAQKQQLRRHIHSAAAVRVAGLYLAPHGIEQGLWAAHIGAVQPPPREGCDGEVFVGHAGEQGRELFKIDLAWGGPRAAGMSARAGGTLDCYSPANPPELSRSATRIIRSSCSSEMVAPGSASRITCEADIPPQLNSPSWV